MINKTSTKKNIILIKKAKIPTISSPSKIQTSIEEKFT